MDTSIPVESMATVQGSATVLELPESMIGV
jgi:hypothetical protein